MNTKRVSRTRRDILKTGLAAASLAAIPFKSAQAAYPDRTIKVVVPTHVTAILIGVIIGPLFEQYLVRALRISQGDLGILFSSTLGNVLWVLLVASLALPYLRQRGTRIAEAPTG